MSLLSRLNRKSRFAKKNMLPRSLRCESLEDRRVLATMVGTEAELVTALAAGDACIELTADITLSGSELAVTQPVEILGGGFMIDAAGMSRVMNIDDGDGYVNTMDVTLADITITGGAGVSSGGGIYNAENLTISGSTITGNEAVDPAMTYTGFGGGMRSEGNLTMSDSMVTGNTAASLVDLPTTGGGFYLTGVGGGLYTGAYSEVNLSYVKVDGNQASQIGGGLSLNGVGTHVIDNSTFDNNLVGNQAIQTTNGLNAMGGGMYVDPGTAGMNLTITNSSFSGNMGGGTGAAGDNTFDYGIGMDITTRGPSDVVTLDNLTISNNIQTSDANGALSVQRGTGASLTAFEGGTFNVTESTISGNVQSALGDFPGYGGGISFSTLDSGSGFAYSGYFNVTDTQITGNTGVRGGAWAARYNGGYGNDGVGAPSIINITDTTASGNSSSGNGGGVAWSWLATDFTLDRVTLDGNHSVGDDSGAIFNATTFGDGGLYANADLTIRNSTITNNTSDGNGGAFVFTSSDLTYANMYPNDVVIENSTISGNSAATGGGAIYTYDSNVSLYQVTGYNNYSAGSGGFQTNRTYAGYVGTNKQAQFALDRSTIAGNTAAGGGGGFYNDYYSTMLIDDSIISGNDAATVGEDLYAANPGYDINFPSNYSIISNSGNSYIMGGTGNQLDVDPLLGPLQDNGGPTLTMLPGAGSPAIDMGDMNDGVGLDQRGYGPRDVGGRMDIGSVEVGAGPTTPDGDFNDDGFWDCLDINALTFETAAGTNNPAFDLTGDGSVNGDDITAWLAEAGGINLMSGNSYAVGDANLDGFVDGLDFIEWNNNKFTATTDWCGGNFNGDGFVDGLDFIEWNNNKFTQQGPISQSGGPNSTIDLLGDQTARQGQAVAQRASARSGPESTMEVADDAPVRSAMRQQRLRGAGGTKVAFAAPTAVSETAVETAKPAVAEKAERVAQNSELASHLVEQSSTEVRRTSDVADNESAIDQIFAGLG